MELLPGPAAPILCPPFSIGGAPLCQGFTLVGLRCTQALAASRESGFLLSGAVGVCVCVWGGEASDVAGVVWEGRSRAARRRAGLPDATEPVVLTAGPRVVRGFPGTRKGSTGPLLWARAALVLVGPGIQGSGRNREEPPLASGLGASSYLPQWPWADLFAGSRLHPTPLPPGLAYSCPPQ